MSTPIGIEAAIPFLSARELAELQRIIREREKKRTRLVLVRPAKVKVALSSRRRTSRRLGAHIA